MDGNYEKTQIVCFFETQTSIDPKLDEYFFQQGPNRSFLCIIGFVTKV